jgi:beta-lactamase superfamily II metal-dependent hydrolase
MSILRSSPISTRKFRQAAHRTGQRRISGASFKMSFFTSSVCNTNNLNNHSIVTILEYASSKIIIPGDNEAASWKELIKDTGFVAAAKNPDVLVAPHHGRQAGYCYELFEAIGKTYIRISPLFRTAHTVIPASGVTQNRPLRSPENRTLKDVAPGH